MVPYFQEIKKKIKKKKIKIKIKKMIRQKEIFRKSSFLLLSLLSVYFIHLLLLTFFRLLFNIELPNSTEVRY